MCPKQLHAMTPENTYKDGSCRACRLLRYKPHKRNACKRGHPMPENRNGRGRCRLCINLKWHERPTAGSGFDSQIIKERHAEKRRKHNRQKHRRYQRSKIEALTHYGPGGVLQCSWPGCLITDPDMMCLDHINNDGNIERAQGSRVAVRTGGAMFMDYLRKQGWPRGYQTLCGGHNLKKQIQLLRRPDDASTTLSSNAKDAPCGE
jgi:hypothetical protein